MGRVDGAEGLQTNSAEEEEMSSNNWKEVKAKIEKIMDQIWLDMPLEVKKVKAGILPHNSGHHGQYLTSWASLMSTTFGWNFYCLGFINIALNDKSITLEQCKTFLIQAYRNSTRYASFIAYPTIFPLWLEIESSFPTVKTKEELKEFMTSWQLYLSRMHMWNAQIFPWHASKLVRTKAAAVIDGKTYFTGKVQGSGTLEE